MSTIEDETGKLWEVLKGDPAYDMVTSLKRKGYQRIVLPVSTLRTGTLSGFPSNYNLTKLGEAYLSLRDEGADEGVLGDTERAFLLAVTLRDCVAPSPSI